MLHLPTPSRIVIVGILILGFMGCWSGSALAENHAAGVSEEDEQAEAALSSSDRSITQFVLAEVDVDYTDIADETNRHSGEQWDLYLETLEICIGMNATSWLRGQITAALEDVGKKDDDSAASISSATLTVQHPGFPLYLIGGKRTQPFGVFKDRLISGTISEDLYEIDETGTTVGLAVDRYAADFSLTVYKGQDIIANLENSGAHEFSEESRKDTGTHSYIVNLTMAFIPETLDFSIFYNREPGEGRDNKTAGVALSLRFHHCTMDTEYITAISRELGENGVENLENAWVIGLAYQATESLELASRFEVFDDDCKGNQDEVVRDRTLAGLIYELSDYVNLGLEYRHSRYERERGSLAADQQNEVRFQLAIEY